MQDGQPGLVVEQMPDQHPVLAGRGELRPVGGDRIVEVELAVDEPAPEIDGGGPADGHRHRCPDLAPLIEVAAELIGDLAEARVAFPLDVHFGMSMAGAATPLAGGDSVRP